MKSEYDQRQNGITVPWTGSPAVILFALSLLLPGCAMINQISDSIDQYYRDREPVLLDIEARIYAPDAYTSVKRVLVLPFENDTEFKAQGKVVDHAFSRELAERGSFEVVRLPKEDEGLVDPISPSTRGQLPIDILIELGSYYRVDAILLGSIKMYNPYSPPVLGLKADLISVHNGKVLRTVSGLLDARKDDVSRDIRKYFKEQCTGRESLFEWRVITASPEMYARYACNRFVKALYQDYTVEEL